MEEMIEVGDLEGGESAYPTADWTVDLDYVRYKGTQPYIYN